MNKEDIQNLAIQFATEGLNDEQKVVYDAWVISASDEDKSTFSEMVDLCSDISIQEHKSTELSSQIKTNLLEKIESNASRNEPTVITIRKDEQEWINLPVKGAKWLELSARKEDGFVVSIIEVASGTEFPEHDHHGVEMAYILEGDLQADGDTLHAGDFFRADAGTHHGTHFSPSGCRALIVTANENYHHRTMKALSTVQKAYRKVRNVFTKNK